MQCTAWGGRPATKLEAPGRVVLLRTPVFKLARRNQCISVFTSCCHARANVQPYKYCSAGTKHARHGSVAALPPAQPDGPSEGVSTKIQEVPQSPDDPLGHDNAVPANGALGSPSSAAVPAAAAVEDGLAPIYAKGFPHRWRITFMMAVAFVLCNMDKVCLPVMENDLQ